MHCCKQQQRNNLRNQCDIQRIPQQGPQRADDLYRARHRPAVEKYRPLAPVRRIDFCRRLRNQPAFVSDNTYGERQRRM